MQQTMRRYAAQCFLLLTICKVTLGQCYYPGPTLATDHYPCDPYAQTTLCCPLGWTCYSNAICVLEDDAYSNSTYASDSTLRGACTNPQWDETYCGDFCLHDPVDDNSGSMISCGDGCYCCSPDFSRGSCSCTSRNGTVQLGSGSPYAIIAGDRTVVPTDGYSSYIAASSLPSSSNFYLTSGSSVASPTSRYAPYYQPSTLASITFASASSSTSSIITPQVFFTSDSPTSAATPTATLRSAAGQPEDITQKTWFKATVGVVVSVTVIALIGLTVWCCCLGGYRRVFKRRPRPGTPPTMIGPSGPAIDPGTQAYPHQPIIETPNQAYVLGPNANSTQSRVNLGQAGRVADQYAAPAVYMTPQRNSAVRPGPVMGQREVDTPGAAYGAVRSTGEGSIPYPTRPPRRDQSTRKPVDPSVPGGYVVRNPDDFASSSRPLYDNRRDSDLYVASRDPSILGGNRDFSGRDVHGRYTQSSGRMAQTTSAPLLNRQTGALPSGGNRAATPGPPRTQWPLRDDEE